MYKIYGISQGERAVDLSFSLPGVAAPGTRDRIGYYMWCLKSEETTLLVDTGMDEQDARKRKINGPEYLEDRLKQIGVAPDRIDTLIVTHLHADHFSAYELYPKASFWVQRKDVEFFTGPAVRFHQVSEHAANISKVIGLAYARRVRYLDGNVQIAPGVRVVLVGGHTPGLQVVVVTTSQGEAVICSDAMNRYRNLEAGVVGHSLNLIDSLEAFDKIRAAASSAELIIPGHDPLVMEKFPSPVEGVVEIG